MSDLSIHPVYLSARAAIIAPERAVPVSLYSIQKWLPRLGPERWCLVMLLRGLCIDSPRRSDGTKRVTCSWRELAEMIDVHEETIANWLKHEPIPNDKPWRAIIADDEKAHYLSLFIPRLRYAYETDKGKTRRVGFLLEVLMEDPVIPEDEARLQQQVELLQMQQGKLGLETYRLTRSVNKVSSSLPSISADLSEPQKTDLPLVSSNDSQLRLQTNPPQTDLHNSSVNLNNSDLLTHVKHKNIELDRYVNLRFPHLYEGKSEEVRKNVNELDILINQLKRIKLSRNSRRESFEPIIRLTETLLNDNHSEAMFYKVLNTLYPDSLDLYTTAIQIALEAAEGEAQVNQGAVFVRALRDLAAEAGIDLGLRHTSGKEFDSQGEEILGTRVPVDLPSLPPLTPPSVNEAIWAETQSILRPQMTRATYDAIIQGTQLIGREEGTYIIAVQTEMAKEWLENRLRDIVRRALSNVVGVTVNVEFELTSAIR